MPITITNIATFLDDTTVLLKRLNANTTSRNQQSTESGIKKIENQTNVTRSV